MAQNFAKDKPDKNQILTGRNRQLVCHLVQHRVPVRVAPRLPHPPQRVRRHLQLQAWQNELQSAAFCRFTGRGSTLKKYPARSGAFSRVLAPSPANFS